MPAVYGGDGEINEVAEALAAMQTETRKRHSSRILPEDNAAKTRNPIGRAMHKEAVQMFATPAECILKDFVEFGDTGCADHEQSPPNQRTHATEHYAKLINRNRRYGRFRHASSLPKPTRTPSNLTPRNLPLSLFDERARASTAASNIDTATSRSIAGWWSRSRDAPHLTRMLTRPGATSGSQGR